MIIFTSVLFFLKHVLFVGLAELVSNTINNQVKMNEDLRFYEPPKITMRQRVQMGIISFGTGYVGAGLTLILFTAIQKQPINKQIIKQAKYSGLTLGTMFAVGSQIQLNRQFGQ